MFLLAHAGITLGAAYALEKTVNCRPVSKRQAGGPADSRVAPAPLRVDYRFILLGAILPDLVDKPLGHILLPDILANGRTFLHTLLFLVITILAALIIYRQKRAMWGVYIAFGVLTHFIMDFMWCDPVTFLWPLYGAFEKHPGISAWILEKWIQTLFEEPCVYLPEAAGFLILLFFTTRLIVQRKVTAFMLQGRL